MQTGIFVKVLFNTTAEGEPFDWSGRDLDEDDVPVCIYGPFDKIEDAVSWMENDYPDNDTDVYDMEANSYELPDHYYINPTNIFDDPVHPDEDIRPESEVPDADS